MKRKIFVVLLSTLFLSCQVNAHSYHHHKLANPNDILKEKRYDSINGLFGLKFNDKIKKYIVVSNININGDKSYSLVKNYNIPTDYQQYVEQVAVKNTKDGLVHEVVAIGPEINRKQCNLKRDEVFAMFGKYGNPVKAKDFNPDGDKKIIDKQGNSVYLSCQGLMSSNLYIDLTEK